MHCTKGLGIWPQVSNDEGTEPDVVMASAGDIPTKESLAAIILLRDHFPNLKIRFINVVDLFRLDAVQRASARSVRPGFRYACSPRTNPSSSTFTAIPG